MKIQPFIFNWKNQFDKTREIEKSLKSIFGKVTVINSDENNTEPGWVNIGNDAYFTAQFYTALSLFDGDVLFHVQGDVYYHKWQKLVEDSIKYMQHYDAGIYAPNLSNTSWGSKLVDLDLKTQHENIRAVSMSDETVWFIKKEIIHEFFRRKIDMSQNKIGWGWDIIFAAICFSNKKLIIRDYNHLVIHAEGRGYEDKTADSQLRPVIDRLDADLKALFIDILTGNHKELEKIFLTNV